MDKITVKDLDLYYGDHHALKDVSIDIPEREITSFIGPSGCGKSTLLRCLNRMNDYVKDCRVEGSIKLDGRDIYADYNTTLLRQRVGMVFQQADDQLFMPTVREDVAFGPLNMGLPQEEIDRRVAQALRDVNAAALADKMTHHLSGGEKRAVSIATVLSMSPDILVLDEPSANLDPASRRTLINLLRRFSHTKIIATHDLDMVMDLCTRCIVMKDGSILADAPVPDIFADCALLEEARLEQPLSYCLRHCGR